MAHLEVDPADGQLDAPLVVRLAGLAPGERGEVESSALDAAGRRWRAAIAFEADDVGRTTIDGSRLVTAMAPAGGAWPAGGPFQLGGAEAVTLSIRASTSEGSTLATASARRSLAAAGVDREVIDDGDVQGVLFRPAGGRQAPAVLDLGALKAPSEARAALLASHGFVTFAFDSGPGGPLCMHPIDRVETALQWLATHGAVRGHRVGVMGSGRGGELALLAAASWPSLVGAVAGWAASGVVLAAEPAAPSSPTDGADSGEGSRPPVSAWSYRGVPVPYLATVDDLRDPDRRAEATIPVERLECPVILITGGADGVWPAHTLAGIARDRLAVHRHPHEVKHLRYIAAGHLLGLPNLPAGLAEDDASTFGGRADADARASADSWPQVVSFMASALGSP